MTKENKIEFATRLHAKLVEVISKRDDAAARWHNTKKDCDFDDVVWFNAQRVILRNLIDDLYDEIAEEVISKGE